MAKDLCAACGVETPAYCLRCAVGDRLERTAAMIIAGFAASRLDFPEGPLLARLPLNSVKLAIQWADELIVELDKRRNN